MSHTIYHDFTITSTLEKVFSAISEPNQLIHWWPQKCTGSPELKGKYNFYFTEEYDWYAEIVEYSKNSVIHYKMTKADSDWDPTTFGFAVKEVDKLVQVEFFHKNWPLCNEHFRTASFCWAILLHALKNYVENGEIVPFEKRS